MPNEPVRRSLGSALLQLARECLSRAGLVSTVIALVAGGIAGFLVSQNLHPSDQFYGNTTILTVGGIAVGFAIDLFFVSPIRKWRDAEVTQLQAEAETTNAENRAAKGEADAQEQRLRADQLQGQLNEVLVNTNAAVLRGLQVQISDKTGSTAPPIDQQVDPATATDAGPTYPLVTRTYTIPEPFTFPPPKTHFIVREEGVHIECSCGQVVLTTQYEAHRKSTFTLYSAIE